MIRYLGIIGGIVLSLCSLWWMIMTGIRLRQQNVFVISRLVFALSVVIIIASFKLKSNPKLYGIILLITLMVMLLYLYLFYSYNIAFYDFAYITCNFA